MANSKSVCREETVNSEKINGCGLALECKVCVTANFHIDPISTLSFERSANCICLIYFWEYYCIEDMYLFIFGVCMISHRSCCLRHHLNVLINSMMDQLHVSLGHSESVLHAVLSSVK